MRLPLPTSWLFLCILLMSCSVSSSSPPSMFGVIYTNASMPDSAFVSFDSNGKISFQEDIPAMGIFQIASDNRGNIFFPVQYENKVYSLSLINKQRKETKSLPYPIYMKQNGNFRVTTFNSSLHSGTVEWKEGRKTQSITIAGFPRIATFDETYIYVFATIIEQKKPLVYVIQRGSGKIDAEIPVKIDQPNDMQIIDNRLYLTSTINQKQIASIDLKTKQVNYLSLPQAQPEYLLPTPHTILITYQGSKNLTEIDRKTGTILRQIKLPQPVFKIKQKGNTLYVLSQIPTNGQGFVGVYNRSNWKLKRKYLLPSIRDTTIQDLIIF